MIEPLIGSLVVKLSDCVARLGWINSSKNYGTIFFKNFMYLFCIFSLNNCFVFSSSFKKYFTINNVYNPTVSKVWIIRTYVCT